MRRGGGPACRVMLLLLVLTLFPLGRVWAEVHPGDTFAGWTGGAEMSRLAAYRDTGGHWAAADITRLALRGVVQGDGAGRFRPQATVAREEVLAMLTRLAGQGPVPAVAARPEEGVSTWAAGYLETASQSGWLTGEERQALQGKWQQPARRDEVTAWVARAVGLAPVDAPQMVYRFQDQNAIGQSYLGLVEAMLREGLVAGQSPTRFNPAAGITRGEAAALLNRAAGRFDALQGRLTLVGNLQPVQELRGGTAVRRLFPVLSTDGTLVYLQTEAPAAGVKTDFPVWRGGKAGGSALLQAGDEVRVLLEGSRVILVEAGSSGRSILSGRLEGPAAGDNLTFVDGGGKIWQVPLAGAAAVQVDGRAARAADLLPGMQVQVQVQLEGGRAVAVLAWLPAPPVAYEPVRPSVFSARVRALDGNDLLVAGPEGDKSYEISSLTRITRGGVKAEASSIRMGDEAKLTVQMPEGTLLAVELAGGNTLVRRVLAGRVNMVDTAGRRLVLEETQQLILGQWAEITPETLTVAPDARLYDGDRQLSWEELAAQARGQQVYLVLAAPWGREEVSMLIFSQGEQRNYAGLVNELHPAGGWLSLEEGPGAMAVGPGTIVIRDRRLVETDYLEEGDTAFLVANREGGNLRAAVVETVSPAGGRYTFYHGRLEEVGANSFVLDDHFELDGRKWEDRSSHLTLEIPWQGPLLDAGASGGEITPEDFALTRYSRKYEDDYVYVVAEDDRAVALAIYPSDPAPLKITVARVAGTAGGVLELRDLRDWSEGYQRWIINSFQLELQTDASLVVRSSRMAGVDELREGDLVLVVHDNNQALLVVGE